VKTVEKSVKNSELADRIILLFFDNSMSRERQRKQRTSSPGNGIMTLKNCSSESLSLLESLVSPSVGVDIHNYVPVVDEFA